MIYPSGKVRGKNNRPVRYERHQVCLASATIDALRSRGPLSASSRCAVDRYLRMVAAATAQLRGVLDGGALESVAAAVRAYQDRKSWSADPAVLVRALAAAPPDLAARHGVCVEEVAGAIADLTLAQTCALLDAVERYWAKLNSGVETTMQAEIELLAGGGGDGAPAPRTQDWGRMHMEWLASPSAPALAAGASIRVVWHGAADDGSDVSVTQIRNGYVGTLIQTSGPRTLRPGTYLLTVDLYDANGEALAHDEVARWPVVKDQVGYGVLVRNDLPVIAQRHPVKCP